MKITGQVSDGFKTYVINWTVTEDGVESHGGSLDASQLEVVGILSSTANVEETVELNDSYDEMTVVDLRTLLSQRGEPIYGNKGDLVARLRGWDAANPDGLSEEVVVVEEPAVEDSGESEEAVVEDESAGEVVE
tara:strand:- start:650 stop:1051 length:402 start_codon:yes stop_codon:yes gene_type:complete